MNQADTVEVAATPFEAIGGEPGVRRLANAFYDAMERTPSAGALRAMHAADLAPMRERLADWLSGWMGGPPVYAVRHPGRPCIATAHAHLKIGPREAGQWLDCMRRAMDETGIEGAWRGPLEAAFTRMCDALAGE